MTDERCRNGFLTVLIKILYFVLTFPFINMFQALLDVVQSRRADSRCVFHPVGAPENSYTHNVIKFGRDELFAFRVGDNGLASDIATHTLGDKALVGAFIKANLLAQEFISNFLVAKAAPLKKDATVDTLARGFIDLSAQSLDAALNRLELCP
jgi:hypothetical protein